MPKSGIITNTLGAIGDELKRDAKVVSSQVTGKQPRQNKQQPSNVVEQVESKEKPPTPAVKEFPTDDDRKSFLQDLYGPSTPVPNEKVAEQKAVDEQETAALRNRLHNETYYQPLIAPAKQQEERAAEKVEREKQEERWDLQKKEEKKPAPLAVKQGQQSAEVHRGVSG